jgi:uncharacterized protein (UPF0333 family)
MKQCKFILLTLIIVIFAGAAITHAAGPRTSKQHRTRSSLASAAIQRWRMGGATHWRSMLIQR